MYVCIYTYIYTHSVYVYIKICAYMYVRCICVQDIVSFVGFQGVLLGLRFWLQGARGVAVEYIFKFKFIVIFIHLIFPVYSFRSLNLARPTV